MTKLSLKFTAIAFALLCLGFVAVGGFFYGKQYAQRSVKNGQQREITHYTNKQLGFELDYPSALNDIQEYPDKVVFRVRDAQDLSGFGVFTEMTSIASTQDWLAAQPKGGASSAGYQLVLWLNDGTALVTETVATEHDEKGEPIYGGKYLWAVAVQNGRLYKVSTPGVFAPNETPRINQETMNILTSFIAPIFS